MISDCTVTEDRVCGILGEVTFSCTESQQTWTVPTGVTEIEVDVYGAAGHECYFPGYESDGGLGGRVEATVPVTPGETLYIYVGCEGTLNETTDSPGGWNGGGYGTTHNAGRSGGSGGGASDIRGGGTLLTDRIVVAGGGGGGGTSNYSDQAGGDGGGTTGANGLQGSCGWCTAGLGGTQSAGGAAGAGSWAGNADPGSFGVGGDGNFDGSGGGGGGGYYGGGGGELCGGGGGSSYTDSGITDFTHYQGVRAGDGQVIITYPIPYQCTPGDNVALLATPTTSGGGTSPYGPDKLNDGALEATCSTDRWNWVDNGADQYYQFEWTEPQTIASFWVDNYSGEGPCIDENRGLESGTVQWLDGSTWVDDVGVSGLSDDWTVEFSTPITTTHLRIYDVGTTNPSIYEWEVYECEYVVFEEDFNGDEGVFTRNDYPFGDPLECGLPDGVTFSNTGTAEVMTLLCVDEAQLESRPGLPSGDYLIRVDWILGPDLHANYTNCNYSHFDENYGANCVVPKRLIVVNGTQIYEDSTIHNPAASQTIEVEYTGAIETLFLAFTSRTYADPWITTIDHVQILQQ